MKNIWWQQFQLYPRISSSQRCKLFAERNCNRSSKQNGLFKKLNWKKSKGATMEKDSKISISLIFKNGLIRNGSHVHLPVVEISYRLDLRTKIWKCLCLCWCRIRLAWSFPQHWPLYKNYIWMSAYIFSRFLMSFTVVSHFGKHLVANDLKKWLSAQIGYKYNAPLYLPGTNLKAERTFQTLKRNLKFSNTNVSCFQGTYIDTRQILEEVHQKKILLGQSPPVRSSDSMTMVK